MRVLVTGASGQLGRDVCSELDRRGVENLGVSSRQLDVTDSSAVLALLLEHRPDAVIHCAAYTKVDQAELEPDRCWLVNAEGTYNLALAAREIGAKLLYISTDYVFRGDGQQPYAPDDEVDPQNTYGLSKLAGELAVRALLDRFFVVRTSWAFGRGRSNFVKTLLRLSETHGGLPVVSDQVGSPTYTADLAVLLCDMIQTDKYGVYHATNEGFCSRDAFAAEVFRVFGRTVSVRPVPSSDFPTLATRPLNSRLSKQKLTEAGFSLLPDWHDALLRYAQALAEEEQDS